MRIISFISFYICLAVTTAYAQAPIEIERKTADGEYMEALAMYDRMPKRIATPLSMIAAAKSAWALGLSERAIAEYDSAIRTNKLSSIELARVYFAKAAILLQEKRPALAVLSIDEGLKQLPSPSPLRGSMYILKAQATASQGLYPATLELLMRAKTEVSEDSETELNYQLGVALSEVGRYAEAKEALKKIPSTHERAVDGIKRLVVIADAEHDPEKAAMWISKGREAYPDSFLDSWYDYLLVTGAIAHAEQAGEGAGEVLVLRDAAVKRLAPSDSWLALILAATEQYSWGMAQPKSVMQPKISASSNRQAAFNSAPSNLTGAGQ